MRYDELPTPRPDTPLPNGGRILARQPLALLSTPHQARRWPQLDPDAPEVPQGQRPRVGIEYGCGDGACPVCYELDEPARYGSIEHPAGHSPWG